MKLETLSKNVVPIVLMHLIGHQREARAEGEEDQGRQEELLQKTASATAPDSVLQHSLESPVCIIATSALNSTMSLELAGML